MVSHAIHLFHYLYCEHAAEQRVVSCGGIYEDPSGNWHELDRAIILLIGAMAFVLCTSLPIKPPILRYVVAYIPSQLLAFAYVWFTGLREPLAKTAYRDIGVKLYGDCFSCCVR